ncbi:MAG TPA: hypothetical protein VFZ70_12345 [Euzebyales bacterium]
MHIPLQIRGTSGMREALVNLGVLFLMAPAARCLVARTDVATGGSLLAAGVLHASWNATGKLSVVDGDLQYVIGLAVGGGRRPWSSTWYGPGRTRACSPTIATGIRRRRRQPADGTGGWRERVAREQQP